MCRISDESSEQLTELLRNAPSNWQRWGAQDEIGSLNLLSSDTILDSVKTISSGKTFTLGLTINSSAPCFPDRMRSSHFMAQDKGTFESGKIQPEKGGSETTEDVILMACHGPTHCDALGHTWFDGKTWNGFNATESKSGMGKAGILPVAEKGIVGRCVLLDIPRYKNVEHLAMHEQITLDDIVQTANFQNTEVKSYDILIIRTGIFNLFFNEGPEKFYEQFDEPGVTYEEDLVKWFSEKEITVFCTDTIMNEQYVSSTVEAMLSMHSALSRNLGIVFNEALWLERWASDSAADKKYDGLYVASPLKIEQGSAAPINPIVIK